MSELTVLIDDALSRRVLQRLGRASGTVSVTSETWDSGFCETCYSLEEGFAVRVDGVQVWPNDQIGGYVYADAQGCVKGGALTVWGYFFDWLDGKPFWEDE